MPPHWMALFKLLKNTRQNYTGGWTPPLPLILAAWHDSMPIAKQLRLKEHLEWAEKQGQVSEIVVHEMLHLLEPTHNERFRALLERYMPRWKERKKTLNSLPVRHEKWGY